jgi:hypothetical protein
VGGREGGAREPYGGNGTSTDAAQRWRWDQSHDSDRWSMGLHRRAIDRRAQRRSHRVTAATITRHGATSSSRPADTPRGHDASDMVDSSVDTYDAARASEGEGATPAVATRDSRSVRQSGEAVGGATTRRPLIPTAVAAVSAATPHRHNNTHHRD